jgi:hypothetical protein
MRCKAPVDPDRGIQLQPVIALQGQHDWDFRMTLYQQFLDAVASHRVADSDTPAQVRV